MISTISFTMEAGVKYSPPFCMKEAANCPMKYSKISPYASRSIFSGASRRINSCSTPFGRPA
jgi:hypothetical protein